MRPFLLILALCALIGRQAVSCASMLRHPYGKLAIASESAAVVWDEKTHNEYFIRRADFQTDEEDIGFLVPTPNRPRLTAASDTALTALEDSIRPKTIYRTETHYFPASILYMQWLGETKTSSLHAAASVTVLEEARVGGYDAAVLRADDAHALTRWLRTHGYLGRPEVEKWLSSYVRRHWVITAFKVGRNDEATSELHLQPVCMAFHAERPFYPYSEPRDLAAPANATPARLLRVFVIANGRMGGSLEGDPLSWPGNTVKARPWIEDGGTSIVPTAEICKALSIPPSALSASAWMTAFEDRSSPRPGVADLVFTPAAQQIPVEPAPEIHVEHETKWIWIDPFIAGAIVVIVVVRRRRTRIAAPRES